MTFSFNGKKQLFLPFQRAAERLYWRAPLCIQVPGLTLIAEILGTRSESQTRACKLPPRKMSGKPTFTSYIGDPPVTQLISIDDNMEEEGSDTGAMAETKENENQSPLINLEDNSEETNNSDSLNRNSPVRLCGYLNKYKVGARGLGKAFKKRWFVHSDNTCKLLYYRTPQDIVPLGEMDVSNATLLLQTGQESDSPAAGRANIFKIR